MTNNGNSGHFFPDGYEPSKSLFWSIIVRNFFWQVLSSPTIWEHRYKISLKNIEIGTGLMGLHRLRFWSCFYGVFL